MNLRRGLCWAGMAAPAAAAFAWTSLASRIPEPFQQRQLLGEIQVSWQPAAWAEVGAEPAHVLGRLLPLLAACVPGIDYALLAGLHAVLAVALALLAAPLLRPVLTRAGLPAPLGLLLGGLWFASPSYGASWLFGERGNLFLPPLCLLLALHALHGAWPLRRRLAVAILLATAAPFTASSGAVVFLALLPALTAATRSLGAHRRTAVLGTFLLLGNAAAIASFTPCGGIALGSQGWLGRLADQPRIALRDLVLATGAMLPDPFADTDVDALLLGGAAWLALALLLRRHRPGPDAADPDATGRSLALFGGLFALLQTERLGGGVESAAQHALAVGGPLLTIGLLRLAAPRLRRTWLASLIGALALLAIADWHAGLETLRQARVAADQRTAQLILPVDHVGAVEDTMIPCRQRADFEALRQRGLVPPVGPGGSAQWALLAQAPAQPQRGVVRGHAPALLHGTVRSAVATADLVLVVAIACPPGGAFAPIGHAWPDFEHKDRNAPWSLPIESPLVEGTVVRVVGFDGRRGQPTPIGPRLVLRQGRLEADGGP